MPPKMNRQFPFTSFVAQTYTLTFSSSSTPSYSFHGSNSSHSKDSGQGGRTYHVPNYATRMASYANEKTHLISVTFDEDKGAKKTIIAIVFMFLFLLSYSTWTFMRGLGKSSFILQSADTVDLRGQLEPPENRATASAQPTESIDSENQWARRVDDGLEGRPGPGSVGDSALASGLYWDELRGDAHCMAYGTRRYTARLRGMPFWANRTRACMETAVQIHGLTLQSPDKCEVNWPFGSVKAYWNVTSKESDCTPVWGKFTDKGCVKRASHKRLYRARLWNVKRGEDRVLLCKTAPAHVAGTFRLVPDTCEDQGMWGTFGSWIIEDIGC